MNMMNPFKETQERTLLKESRNPFTRTGFRSSFYTHIDLILLKISASAENLSNIFLLRKCLAQRDLSAVCRKPEKKCLYCYFHCTVLYCTSSSTSSTPFYIKKEERFSAKGSNSLPPKMLALLKKLRIFLRVVAWIFCNTYYYQQLMFAKK